MNKIGSVVFCFLIVSSMLIFPIQSDASQQDEIIYVDDDNTDGPWEGSFEHPFQYIQEGINASMDGDTVFVFDGNYQENLLISVSIVLQGNNKSTTIIDGNSKNNSAITIICDFVYITGFTISNGPIGIDLKGSCKTTIFNNLIQNNNLYGLRLNHFSNYNIIENNIIHNNSWAGINFHDSSDNLVIDNNINDNDDQGIIIFSSRDNRIIHNSIRDNVIGISLENDVCNISIIDNEFYRNGIKTRNSLSDCLLHTVVNNTINEKPLVYLQKKSNLVINNAGQVLLIDCNNVSIQNLDIISLNIGIFLLESSNCSITNNNISQCKYGMYIFYGNNNTISHNIIQNNTNDGILIHMSNSNFIINNKIFTNSVSGIRLFDFSKNNKIIGNTITNNKNGLWLSFFADYNLTLSD
jgi:parallel beta-helix repeat protein